MRQRARRELITIVGVVVILAVVAILNYTFKIGSDAAEKEAERLAAVNARTDAGMEILKWRHMRKTKGTLRKGAIFTDELKKWNHKQINLVGFMVPENEFRNMTEFMLLPLPIECYFCNRPPVRDVMAIQMAESSSTMLYDGPVLINGILRLHEGPNQKYFYSIEHAAIAPAEEGGRFRNRFLEPEHMVPEHATEPVLEPGIKLSGDS